MSDKLASLADALLEAARTKGITLGCAESCTGGMIASALTSIAGSSECFVGGVVSYWPEVKESVLNVSPDAISKYGVVSECVAGQMSEGACRALGCDYAVSTTGIAGPTGAEPGKPVGTVCYGVTTPLKTVTYTACMGDTRSEVRLLATEHAMSLLLDALEE